MNRLTEIVWSCIDFVGKYKRYFAAGCVGIFMVFLLAYGTDNSAADANPLTGAYQSYSQEDTDSEIVKLLETYYAAYADNDIDALESVASPVSDKEKSYIAFLSDAIDAYDVEQVYTKRGVDDDSYLVSAEIAIHFRTLENAAPGLDFFYVTKDDDGRLVIDNTYSTFNQQNGEYEMDPTVSSLIAEFEQQDDVLALEAEVQSKYNELLMTDSLFNTFSTDALPESIQAWASGYTAALEEEKAKAAEEEAKKKEEEEKAAEEAKKAAEEEEAQKAAEEAQAQKEANAYQVKAIAKVNVRSEATKDSAALGKAAQGETFTAYSEEGDWTLIKYGDGEGYIKTEFLEKQDTEAADTAAADGGDDGQDAAAAEDTETSAIYSAGQRITLPTTVNVRSSMSQSASKVAVAYAGETVEVVMMYEEGWTKVKYDGKEGYVKTEFLQ